jgi:hypothetical protein
MRKLVVGGTHGSCKEVDKWEANFAEYYHKSMSYKKLENARKQYKTNKNSMCW